MAGSVQQEMEDLLKEAFSPTRLEVINDSAKHSGHAGDDGSGESHFTVVIEAPAFAYQARVKSWWSPSSNPSHPTLTVSPSLPVIGRDPFVTSSITAVLMTMKMYVLYAMFTWKRPGKGLTMKVRTPQQ